MTVCREARSCGSGEHEIKVAESPLQIADMKCEVVVLLVHQ